jgi:Flp pilus assembly protein TadD
MKRPIHKHSELSSQERRRQQLHERAFDCIEANDFQGGAKCIAELLRGDPREPWVDHFHGFLQSEIGNQADAIPLLRRAAARLPKHVEPRISLGIALMKSEEYDEAEELLERALAMEPNSFLAMTNLACVLLTRVENPCPERAEKLLREADKLKPDDAAVWANLGHALAQQEKWQEAYPALKKAIQLDHHGASCRRIAMHYPELADAAERRLAETEAESEMNLARWLKTRAIAKAGDGK